MCTSLTGQLVDLAVSSALCAGHLSHLNVRCCKLLGQHSVLVGPTIPAEKFTVSTSVCSLEKQVIYEEIATSPGTFSRIILYLSLSHIF